MNDCSDLMSLKAAIRDSQDQGILPADADAGRRFQVLAAEIAVPVLRELRNTLCLEGVTANLLMALDELTPYVGLEVEDPHTTLWIHPSFAAPEVQTSIQGGRYPLYCSVRHLSYRVLTPASLETILVEQLRLVLCPPQPIM
ncbi:MAG: hypothetical protein BVN29_06630 [Nitrospira sp. ST-bin5]|nr:MAG: hypothetical protein BVN29_06630 [Nitrospira sp. ST-bin5]